MKPLYYLVDDGCRGEPPRRGAPPVAGLGNDWGTRQYLPDDVQAPTYAQRVKADLPGSTGVRDLDPREISEAAFGDDRVIGERMAFRGDDGARVSGRDSRARSYSWEGLGITGIIPGADWGPRDDGASDDGARDDGDGQGQPDVGMAARTIFDQELEEDGTPRAPKEPRTPGQPMRPPGGHQTRPATARCTRPRSSTWPRSGSGLTWTRGSTSQSASPCTSSRRSRGGALRLPTPRASRAATWTST